MAKRAPVPHVNPQVSDGTSLAFSKQEVALVTPATPPEPDPSKEDGGEVYREWMRLFGVRFREARLKAGLTQYAVSQQLYGSTGGGQAYISKVELGQVNLTAKTMAQLADIIGCDLGSLIHPTHS